MMNKNPLKTSTTMKNKRTYLWIVLLAFLSTFNPQPSTVFAQGSLTPPGAPAPTMKTLAQIEPRTPVSSAPFTISVPGSYYLTTNLTVSSGNAITIATSGVTLDLNGFTIASTAPSATGNGILLSGGLRNITIQNGFIQGGVTNNSAGSYSGSGFGYGIYYSGSSPGNILVSRVSVSGCLNYGIWLSTGDSTVVESCTVRMIGSYGIGADTIKSSSATDCGSYALFGVQVSDCRGQSSGSEDGVNATTAQNCYGRSSYGNGVSASTAQNCYGDSTSGTGLLATTAQNCYGSSTSGTGLSASTTVLNCYGHSSGTFNGLYATTALNCYGSSSGGRGLSAVTAQNCSAASSSDFGLYATTAQNCYGHSGSATGLYATTAQNCYGYSGGSGYGLYASDIAIGCLGYSSSGTGLTAYIANSCRGTTSTGTAQTTIAYKYNMP
jgi:hypothetical protein